MKLRKVVIPLAISEISPDVLPVVRNLFDPENTIFTLVAVAQPLETLIIAGEPYMATMSSSVYSSALNRDEWEKYRRELSEKLEEEARQLRAAGYSVNTALLTGEKVREIVNFVNKRDFDLLAVATYARTGLSRLVYGSVAERLLRLVNIPMLLARHQALPQEQPMLSEQLVEPEERQHELNLIVATDGSSHGQEAVRLAEYLAKATGASLHVLVSARGKAGSASGQEVMSKVSEMLGDYTPRPELVPLVGPPDEVIAQYIDDEEKPSDMLIIGSFMDRGTGGKASIGLTAQRLLQTTPLPVLMVKGQGKPIQRILAYETLDNDPVIDNTLALADALNAELHFLHILPTEGAPEAIALDDIPADAGLAQDTNLSSFLQESISTLREMGLTRNSLKVWRGQTIQAILAAAEAGDYDLIVVNAPADARFFTDSLADEVVRYAPQSVLVMRA